MLANLHFPRTLDGFVHLLALTFSDPLSHVAVHEATAEVAGDDEPTPRPGHVLGDEVGVALYNATLAGARPWGC